MFELIAGVAGWACALLFIAALFLLGYTLWELVTSDRKGPPLEPRRLASQPVQQDPDGPFRS